MLSNKAQIAVFASGNGTNAENIASYFEQSEDGEVVAIFCNNPDAYVIKRAERMNIPVVLFTKEELNNSEKVLKALTKYHIDFIVLAGFLWLIPQNILTRYKKCIINIHPALLPKYGGKGMYGDKVHQAVVEAGDNESGITIHYVNPFYDEGDIICQKKCQVNTANDNAESIAAKIHQLEYEHYPKIVEELIKKLKSL